MDLSPELILQALEKRKSLFLRLQEEKTDCYRLFHGVSEGNPGLTVDRYGPIWLVQTFREPLSEEEIGKLETCLLSFATNFAQTEMFFVYNHRGDGRKSGFDRWHKPQEQALTPRVCYEMGLKYVTKARHRGQDPLLFLDLRAARRYVLHNANNLTVLNLFAYTCGVGVCAMAGGAKEAWNVDFASSALEIGMENARLNEIREDHFHLVQEDVFCALHQFGNIPMKGRGARRKPNVRMEPQLFDLVFLDPPAWASSPYGAVDLVRDYQSLFKPCLLATVPGGKIVAVNNVANVKLEPWLEILRKCANKAGRPLRDITVLKPDEDFPSWDNNPPLKIAICEVS